MTHAEHVNLIRQAITRKGGIWADLGSGDGAFTLALRDLAGENVEIYSLDKDISRLHIQEQTFVEKFPQTHIHFIEQDFTRAFQFPALDGIIMANSLHYVKNQISFLSLLKQYLKPKGELVIVEYNIDTGNPWVPYPLSYTTFVELMHKTGFVKPMLLKQIPSTYWNEMYSAKAQKE